MTLQGPRNWLKLWIRDAASRRTLGPIEFDWF
jgi:hypothetical protein